MLRPEFITFTGADDKTSPDDLLPLAASRDVEFAILFSGSAAGKPRYPTAGRIRDFASRSGSLRLAAHICGRWSKEILAGGRTEADGLLRGFRRVQVNTSQDVDVATVLAWRDRVQDAAGHEIEIILQTRGAFPDDGRVSWLFDPSGGRGIAQSAWPASPPPGVRGGFAGGLGPDNVAQAVLAMPPVTGGWIDMETKIRNGRDLFDTGLCRTVCDRVNEALAAGVKRAAFVTVTLDDGRIAATTRPEQPGRIGLPGGRQELNESLTETAIREAAEEGWQVASIDDEPYHVATIGDFECHWFRGHGAVMLESFKERGRVAPLAADIGDLMSPDLGNDVAMRAYQAGQESGPGI